MITKVQIAPNNTEDDQLLAEARSDLVERLDLKPCIIGVYGDYQQSRLIERREIFTTGIRGKSHLKILASVTLISKKLKNCPIL